MRDLAGPKCCEAVPTGVLECLPELWALKMGLPVLEFKERKDMRSLEDVSSLERRWNEIVVDHSKIIKYSKRDKDFYYTDKSRKVRLTAQEREGYGLSSTRFFIADIPFYHSQR